MSCQQVILCIRRPNSGASNGSDNKTKWRHYKKKPAYTFWLYTQSFNRTANFKDCCIFRVTTWQRTVQLCSVFQPVTYNLVSRPASWNLFFLQQQRFRITNQRDSFLTFPCEFDTTHAFDIIHFSNFKWSFIFAIEVFWKGLKASLASCYIFYRNNARCLIMEFSYMHASLLTPSAYLQ